MNWKKNMKPLNLSSLHGILIEDEEGNIQPMDEPYFKAKEIAPGTWQVLSDGDYTYVIEGDDEIIAIDSGMGAGNIRAFCQTLSNKPLYRMFNTHNHFDHTLNNYLFDVVYMSEKSYEGRCEPFGEFAGMDIPNDYPVVFLKDGDVVNLKGRELQVFNIEEHRSGSLQFLDRKQRILFCGDELNGNFFDSRISVEQSYRNVKRWMSFRDSYDLLCAGNGIHDASYVDKYYATLEYILDGHENEGVEFYVPYADRRASISSKDGKLVFARRAPHLDSLEPLLREAGYEKHLELNGGKACFCLMRKLTEDGIFDRQLEKNGCRVCYYLNRIWDK
ncbi:MBL fold metallo-hydrolase [Acetanaerobacterium elongatum]|uniref:Glyoxylase, beta-lactamase superfamily II n=1 Tax=Acetanaerobacterium elongatum TaxID=258515 RepID=A0A1H0H0V7_9FIRM|nr:MBL fold metallo-hydrolase [Acetanaerobacterium elongatum]SDO12769.1 Glyoxylase, beta-lactamase superfamily II [Acetanaerobacterium elongatum]